MTTPRQTVVIVTNKDGNRVRVEPANLDYLPKTYAKIERPGRRFDKFDAMYRDRVERGQIAPPKSRSGSNWDKARKP